MKSFKEFLTEAKLGRRQASDLKKGDVIQPNVVSAKELGKTWGKIVSIQNKGRDVILKLSHVTYEGGREKELGSEETINAMDRQVFAVRIDK